MTSEFQVAGWRASADEIRRWDRDHSWHPFTPMREYLAHDPVVIARGEGAWLEDIDGHRYLDGVSSVWMNLHGHNHPVINQAVTDQLQQIAHATTLGQANVPATLLAKELTEVAPDGLQRVQLSDSGASAVEIAVKIAIQYWAIQGRTEKQQVLGFHNNYHGDTLGAMAVAPCELFHKPFLSLLPFNPRLPFPADLATPWVEVGTSGSPDLVTPVENYLAAHADEIAAVIIEPVEGAGGMIPATAGYLSQLKRCCERHEVLLIVDEVATGFGHTGHLFACTAEQVTPDVLCLGKALTAGYLPVAATLTTEAIYEAFLGPVEAMRTLYHGHSFAGNPLGCAAALASLRLLPPLLEELPQKVKNWIPRVQRLSDSPLVAEVRQRGLMVGLPMQLPAEHTESAAIDGWGLRRIAFEVAQAARRRGLLLRPIGNVVILLPPPAATREELQMIVERLQGALDEVAERLPTLLAEVVTG